MKDNKISKREVKLLTKEMTRLLKPNYIKVNRSNETNGHENSIIKILGPGQKKHCDLRVVGKQVSHIVSKLFNPLT